MDSVESPERLNGLTHGIKRDLVETITQAQMDHRVRCWFSGSAGLSRQGMISPVKINPYPVRRYAADSAWHDSEIGTYEGLRHLSQTLNLAIRIGTNCHRRIKRGCDSNRHDHGTACI